MGGYPVCAPYAFRSYLGALKDLYYCLQMYPNLDELYGKQAKAVPKK